MLTIRIQAIRDFVSAMFLCAMICAALAMLSPAHAMPRDITANDVAAIYGALTFVIVGAAVFLCVKMRREG